MTLDPKWLNILKDDDDRLAVAVACGFFLLAVHWGWLPPLPSWVVPLAWFGCFLFGSLFGVKFLVAVCVLIHALWLASKEKRRVAVPRNRH